jgi:hypothetical protein
VQASNSGGGPLVPIYDPKFETDVVCEEDEERPAAAWTLYGSIWGPRCEWCDGSASRAPSSAPHCTHVWGRRTSVVRTCGVRSAEDFFDHEEVLFERFASDWQLILRLGVLRMIREHDDNAAADDDGDVIPDELEDVGAVMFMHHPVIARAWLFYADALYGSGDDLQTGIKQVCPHHGPHSSDGPRLGARLGEGHAFVSRRVHAERGLQGLHRSLRRVVAALEEGRRRQEQFDLYGRRQVGPPDHRCDLHPVVLPRQVCAPAWQGAVEHKLGPAAHSSG